jgi:hypothetical protein
MKKNDKQRLFEVMGRLDKTFKPKLNEDIMNAEPEEHQNEGATNKAKLEELVKMAKKAYKHLPDGELPSWVQDNITIAKERLGSVCGWLHSEEEAEETDMEGEHRDMDDEEEHDEEAEETETDEEESDDEESEEESEEPEKESKPKIPVKNW